MLFIQKSDPPAKFCDWLEKRTNDWHPTWDNLAGDPKESLHKTLVEEQFYLCAYCECKIDTKDSHIEHLRPRNGPNGAGGLELEYKNMVASCVKQQNRTDPNTCGHAKSMWYDDVLFVHPLSQFCNSRFRYLLDGRIAAFDDEDCAATETINRLNLNLQKLVERRRSVIEFFIEYSDLRSAFDNWKANNSRCIGEFPSHVFAVLENLDPDFFQDARGEILLILNRGSL
jgi:uncharacterized protein (TIGR02646 family)